MASVIFVIFLTSLLIDKWVRWMMDLSKLLTIIVSLITVLCISFMGAWIWNDRFLNSGALRNFLSSRPNFSIAIELVVLILKGSLSTKLNTISCVRVMRLTRMEGRKGMEGALMWMPLTYNLWCSPLCGGDGLTNLLSWHLSCFWKAPCTLNTALYSTNGEPNSPATIALFVCLSFALLSSVYMSVAVVSDQYQELIFLTSLAVAGCTTDFRTDQSSSPWWNLLFCFHVHEVHGLSQVLFSDTRIWNSFWLSIM